MSERYQVIEGSESKHCCFEATIIDTQRPHMIDGEQVEYDGIKKYEQYCECFAMEDAVAIVKVLNAADDQRLLMQRAVECGGEG